MKRERQKNHDQLTQEALLLCHLERVRYLLEFTVCLRILYTPVKSYVVKEPQEKWACDFHDDAPPLSFQLQVTEDFF